MKEGTSMTQQLKHMKDRTDKLSATGATISEEDQVVTLLGSLPGSYDNLVTALEARVYDLTLQFVYQSLINEEQKRQENDRSTHGSHGSDATALHAYKKKPMRTTQHQKKVIICNNCNKPGHNKSQCRSRPVSSENSVSNHRHTAKHATSALVKTGIYGGDEKTADENDGAAFIRSVHSGAHASVWLLDSGASSHMTSYQNAFDDYKWLMKPEKASLGDGRTVEAIGVGTVKVMMKISRKVNRAATLYNVLHVPKLTANLFSLRSATDHVTSFSLVTQGAGSRTRMGR